MPTLLSQCGSNCLQSFVAGTCLQTSLAASPALRLESFWPAESRNQPHRVPDINLLTSSSPGLPFEIFFSDSDSDAAYIRTPSSPKQKEKPKPSAAPHLRQAASASKPADFSLSLPKKDFGYQINFDFCKKATQTSAYSSDGPTPGSRPKNRACAKLLVRSGLRCSCCFRLKSACLCLKHSTRLYHLVTYFRPRCLAYIHGPGLPLSSRRACVAF